MTRRWETQAGPGISVRTNGATGVRWPRPCPFTGCAVLLADSPHRDRHLVEHVEQSAGRGRAPRSIVEVAVG